MTSWVRTQVGILHALGWLPGERSFAGVHVAKGDAVRAAVWMSILLTALFYAPALVSGYFADDIFHVFALSELPELFRRQLNLFSFVHSPEEIGIFRKWGILPWWTSDTLKIDFFRPIPSITHWLDFALFGRNPAAAHLVSIAWYMLSIGLVYRVLARFIEDGSRTLLLAVAIFALDDTHALNVQWLANRNDIIAAVFLLTAFLGWLRLTEGKGSPRTNVAMTIVGFVCALLSKESSVVLPALILAHAVILPANAGNKRLVDRVRPHLFLHATLGAIAVVYVVLYFKTGHGPNSVYYLNPGKNPALWAAQFFRSGFFHAVILATGVPLHVLSSSPVRDYPVPAAFVAALTIGFWATTWKLLRHDRKTRFFVAWMVIAQLILTTSFPDPRILYLPSIGFAYVVARVMQEAWRQRDEWKLARPVVVTLVALHLVFAPILDQICLHVVNSFQDSYASVQKGVRENVDFDQISTNTASTESTTVFFLNWHQREATALANLYLSRTLPSGAEPGIQAKLADPSLTFTQKVDQGFAQFKVHYYALSFLIGEIDARVINDHEITLSPKQGQFFPSLFDQLYLTSTEFKVGQTFEVPAFRATVEALNEQGEVTRVRFTFPKPLSSPSYKFLAWDGQNWKAINLAEAVGGRLALRAPVAAE